MITFEDLRKKQTRIAVVGLGYVGLPLAVAFSRHFEVMGFDISARRVRELSEGLDRTGEVSPEALRDSGAVYTSEPSDLSKAGLIIVAVPTPIDANRRPDLKPIMSASETVGRNMRKGALVVFESTVYPGLTEEICVPILESCSGFTLGRDFWVGYSPERINPGDKVHTLETIVKVVAGMDEPTAGLLAEVYGTVVKAGIHKVSNIKVAEAAKVIENTQRDLNIALMNELALIFGRLGIDTTEVLEAAGTKWNFLPFRPGLVGGHCIGVDPYYLTHKAEALGFHPQVILAGRRINDFMGKYVAEIAVKKMIAQDRRIKGARAGVLGLTFKENVADLRNTRVVDIIQELEEYGAHVLVHDPLADPKEAEAEYGLTLVPLEDFKDLDVLILAVPHQEYKELGPEKLASFLEDSKNGLLLDVKGALNQDAITALGLSYWRL